MQIKKIPISGILPITAGQNNPTYFNTLWFKQTAKEKVSIYFTDNEGYTVSVGEKLPQSYVKTVAASDSSALDKAFADYVCTGTNDEIMLQSIIDSMTEGGTIQLMVGTYNIDSFPNAGVDGLMTALYFKKVGTSGRFITIQGVSKPQFLYGKKTAILNITQKAYDSIGTSQVAVISGTNERFFTWCASNSLKVKDLIIRMPDNQKPIICLDFRQMATGGTDGVWIYPQTVYDNIYGGTGRPPIPNTGLVGIYEFRSSNSKYYTEFRWTIVHGCHEGFKCGGDHVVHYSCATSRCTYGYTIGTYNSGIHPMEFFYCTDETNSNFPLFGEFGNNRFVRFIDFQSESIPSRIPAESFGYAREINPGSFFGEITWSSMEGDVTAQFWNKDGSGLNFKSRNAKHAFVATSAAIKNWRNMHWGEDVFAIDLGKKIMWNGDAWTDMSGVIISL